jgi:hypothetical protein
MQSRELTEADLERDAMMLREGLVTKAGLEVAISASPYAFLIPEHRRVLQTVLARL